MNRQNSSGNQRTRSRRPQKRQLCCPAHPEQLLEGNGKKYFLHLLKPEELRQRGMNHQRSLLVIKAYPGGAVLPAMRRQPLVPHHPARPRAAHGALGTP